MSPINKVKPLDRHVDAYRAHLHVYGLKYVALFDIALLTGGRISDILGLRFRDVLRRDGCYKYRESKTGKYKTGILPDTSRDFLKSVKRYYNLRQSDYIVQGRYKDRPLSRVQAYRVLRKAGQDLDIYGIGPHSLRKTYAIALFRDTNGDLRAVAKALNHDNVSTTLIHYLLSHLTTDQFYGLL